MIESKKRILQPRSFLDLDESRLQTVGIPTAVAVEIKKEAQIFREQQSKASFSLVTPKATGTPVLSENSNHLTLEDTFDH